MKKIISIILILLLLTSMMVTMHITSYADQLNEGVYNFVCADGGRYLNVYAGQDKDGANVCVWEKDGSPEQNFKMVDRGGNRYVLYPASSSSGRVLDANRGNSYSNPLQAGNNIDIWQTNDAPAQEWYIDDQGTENILLSLLPHEVLLLLVIIRVQTAVIAACRPITARIISCGIYKEQTAERLNLITTFLHRL